MSETFINNPNLSISILRRRDNEFRGNSSIINTSLNSD